MPALIDAPRDKEQVKAFLADGITEGVPAIQASDINDGDILNGTTTVELGNGYKFVITLPSGRVLESAPVGSDYPKRDAMLAWLGAVRDSIVEDGANAARAARDAHLAESRLRDLQDSTNQRLAQPVRHEPATPGYTGADPVEYARAMLREALGRVAALGAAEIEVAKWQRVVNSLTGESSVKKRRKKRKVRKPISANTVG